MFEVITVSILATLIAMYGSYAKQKHPLWVPMIMLAIFFSLRYNYTMDYIAYERMFNSVNAYENMNYYSYIRGIETGWKVLNRLLAPLGYQSLIAVTTFFQLGVFVWFAEKYISRKWQWVALMIYVFDPWYMLMHLSTMRQTMSMSVLVLSLPYIFDRKIFKALLIWAVALTFHKTAWIALPIMFVGYLKPRYWRLTAILIGSIIGVSALIPAFFFDIAKHSIGLLGAGRFEIYIVKGSAAQLGSGVGLLYRMAFIGYLIYSMKKSSRKMFIFIAIYCMAMPFQLMGMTGMYFGRLGWYFSYLGLPGLLVYVYNWRKSLLDRTIFVVYICLEIYTYLRFFVDYFPSGFLHYETVLEF